MQRTSTFVSPGHLILKPTMGLVNPTDSLPDRNKYLAGTGHSRIHIYFKRTGTCSKVFILKFEDRIILACCADTAKMKIEHNPRQY